MQLHPNTLLQGGKYKIVRFINAGGFGNTYEGLDVNLNKRVAIKEFFVKDFCGRDAATIIVTVTNANKGALFLHLKERFWKEAQAIAQMEHENIVDVKALFEENGTAYYVMDFIDGESVGALLKRRGSLLESEALPIIRKVASALDYMHKQNRFHLDVKPGNIMLRKKDGKVVLIDFGSSKQYAEVDGENTTTMSPCYTPGYAPSEQMNPKATRFTAATDVYALGATLYKMLTGVTPPSAIDLQNEDETLSSLPKEVSAGVRKCVQKAMIPQRNKRLQSIEEFLAMLNNRPTTVDHEEEVTIVEVKEPERQAPPAPKFENRIFKVNGVSFKMIAVKGGTFRMGSNDTEAEWNEKPIHDVTLSNYYIGETQVTQELWKAVMGNNPSHFKGDNLPVESISWDDCQKFIGKLNRLTGKTFRLPTEAEWEYAARGGQKSLGYKYSGSNNIDEVAWYEDNSHTRTGWFGGKKEWHPHPVATKKANELGVYDMSGNVWEWCQDWYGSYSSTTQTNPKGPSSGSYRVYRGGSWDGSTGNCRSSGRGGFAPVVRLSDLGLRLAL